MRISQRSGRFDSNKTYCVLVFLISFLFWCSKSSAQTSLPCDAPGSIACAKFSVSDQLQKESAHLSGNEFKPYDSERISIIDKGGGEEFRVELDDGVEYAIIAACGKDCSHVEARLLNEKQETVAASPDKQATIILNGSVPAKGTYIVTVTAPGCNHMFCGVGLTIMRK
jgi:hypothetical protein